MPGDASAWLRIAQHTFAGLSLGSILVLLALGLSIIFGLMRVINLAHGEFMMVGAYTAYVTAEIFKAYAPASLFDAYFLLALPLAFLVQGPWAGCARSPSSGTCMGVRSKRCSPPGASACC